MATATYSDTGVPRDANLADTIYSILPARTLDLSSADLRADSTHTRRSKNINASPATKRNCTTDSGTMFQYHDTWPGIKFNKRRSIPPQKNSHVEMHQSTCLSLDNTESDLWILPDFEEWEAEAEPSQRQPMKQEGEWASLMKRAANSNRERLRRRLEGDGWDFVGGKYGEDGKVYEAETLSEESVDEEFDVVVLPVVAVS